MAIYEFKDSLSSMKVSKRRGGRDGRGRKKNEEAVIRSHEIERWV